MSKGLGAVERWLLQELPEAPEWTSVLDLAARRAGTDPAPRATLESVRRAAKSLARKELAELGHAYEKRPEVETPRTWTYKGNEYYVTMRPGVTVLRVRRPLTPEQAEAERAARAAEWAKITASWPEHVRQKLASISVE